MRHASAAILPSLLGLALAGALLGPAARVEGAAPAATPVYVGTYTGSGSRGIYRFTLDTATGAAGTPVLVAETRNPSFLALHPNGRVLYAVNEVDDFEGQAAGSVGAFAIDPATGKLTLINRQSSQGAGPCHLFVDHAGRDVLVANYDGGTVAVLPIGADGRLAPASCVRAHEGTGPNRARQDKPHAHGIWLDAAERFALATDLGADRIFVYRFDAVKGTLEPHGAVPLAPGSGPRHLAFDPSGRTVFAISELRSTVSSFAYDATAGTLRAIQTVSTLPADFKRGNTAAEVVLSPDGRYLYASNRGDDSLAVFAVDAVSGRLTPAGRIAAGGRTPRHFAIDATGRWLIVALQDSNAITILRRDPASGQAAPTATRITLSKPVCVLPVPAAR